MPKIAKELSDAQVRRLKWGKVKSPKSHSKRAGDPCVAYHAVGGVSGLLLQCRPPEGNNDTAGRSWILRATVGTKRRDIGLGGYPDVTLAMARDKARLVKEKIRQGIDPIAEKKAAKSALILEQAKAITFEQLAAEYITKKSKELKTAKQVQKLTNHLKNYAYPYLGKMVLSDVERANIVAMLKPIWEEKTETANRVRQAVENILDLATVKGLRVGENPARWKGNLDLSFPSKDKIAKTQHYSALAVNDMPEFLPKLKQADWMGAKALEFIIYTAARSGEVRGATWGEVDLKAKVWVIPAERMKSGRQHQIPLSDSAIQLLESLPRESDIIFFNTRGGQLSDATVSKAPKRIGYDVTAHGFRATFRTWAQEYTAYPEEVVELALAHVNSDATRAAYARSELIEKRRLLMGEWEAFCINGVSADEEGKVVSIGGRQ